MCLDRMLPMWLFGQYIAIIPIGAIAHVETVWKLADFCIAMMLICNMVGVIGLSRLVIKESRQYFAAEKSMS
ncbi:MAG: hypothetical protein K940chlam7_01853 [Chlamydiae bacterium]|nr:hypothetical protein [Chlamydiota bacterium]